ncbi:hypothetical protein GGX14DRAFT_311382, partial [Mycena pura]
PRPHIDGTQITLLWLQKLKPHECRYEFRFYLPELERLVEALQIPDPFKTSSRYVFSAIEALCLLLARFRSAGNIYDLTKDFGRGATAIAELINELVIYLDDIWKHLLDYDDEGILAPEALQQYADAIRGAGAPLDSVWGFIDCTIRNIARPSHWQRAAYNGYKKYHALKYQAV